MTSTIIALLVAAVKNFNQIRRTVIVGTIAIASPAIVVRVAIMVLRATRGTLALTLSRKLRTLKGISRKSSGSQPGSHKP